MISKEIEKIHIKKETRSYACNYAFLFLCVSDDDLSFINIMQKTLKLSKKVVSMPQMDERKNFIYTKEFQQKGSGSCASMRCKLLQKRFTGKTCVPNTLHHIAIEKDILSKLNKCIFQVSLKYINWLS